MRRPLPRVAAILLLGVELGVGLGVGFAAAEAAAHSRSQSFSSWHLREGEVRLEFTVRALEATRLRAGLGNSAGDLGAALRDHVGTRIRVDAGGESCPAIGRPRSLGARDGFLRLEWRFACPTLTSVEIESDAFFDLAPTHIHYARIRGGTAGVSEYLFTDAERRHAVTGGGAAEPSGEAASFGAYLELGVEHILGGVDHLAFLAALLLLCRRLRDVVWMVTGFTLGHSVTLSLAVLGVVEPDVPVIEALIGFTIALVAAENVGVITGSSRGIAWLGGAGLALLALAGLVVGVGPPVRTLAGLALFTVCYLPLAGSPEAATRLRPLLTVAFGLIHGFGFASVLIEIGMPPGRLASALFGFNVGVEIGQLAVVAVLWGVGTQLGRRLLPAQGRLAVEGLSSALCALGLYWFVERSLTISSLAEGL